MKEKTALLVMDVQQAITKMIPEGNPFLENVTNAISNARKKNIPVIYCTVGFRSGYPEVSENNKSFTLLKQNQMQLDQEESYKVHPQIAPLPGEIALIKRRVSAFSGNDLEIILRSQQINHLILTGISTSGVVLSTIREAADKDYKLTVLSDCCLDLDEEVHTLLMTKIFPKQANVITSKDL